MRRWGGSPWTTGQRTGASVMESKAPPTALRKRARTAGSRAPFRMSSSACRERMRFRLPAPTVAVFDLLPRLGPGDELREPLVDVPGAALELLEPLGIEPAVRASVEA